MIIIYLLKLFFIYLLGLFYFFAAAFIRIFDREAAFDLFEKYLKTVLRILSIDLSFEFDQPQIKNSTNVIFVALNQSSFLDGIAWALIPVRPMKGIINIEFALYPVLGWFLSLVSFVIIRQWPSQAKRTLNRSSQYLQSGGNIIISIEGKRSRDGKINEYKKGPVVMAINNKADIVPFIAYGSRECLPYGSLRVKPGAIKLRFFKPISTQGLTYDDRNSLRDQLLKIVQEEV